MRVNFISQYAPSQKILRCLFVSIFFLGVCQTHSSSEKKSKASSTSSPSQSIFRVEGAYSLFSGETGSSFAGAKGYSVTLGLEKDSGTFRLFANAQIDYLPATSLDISGSTTSINYTGFKAAFGGAIFPLTGSGMQPFLSAAGTYSRGGVNVSPETPELTNFFRTNFFGYELSVGVDFKASRSGKSRFRIRASYATESGKFASVASLKNDALKVSAGIGF